MSWVALAVRQELWFLCSLFKEIFVRIVQGCSHPAANFRLYLLRPVWIRECLIPSSHVEANVVFDDANHFFRHHVIFICNSSGEIVNMLPHALDNFTHVWRDVHGGRRSVNLVHWHLQQPVDITHCLLTLRTLAELLRNATPYLLVELGCTVNLCTDPAIFLDRLAEHRSRDAALIRKVLDGKSLDFLCYSLELLAGQCSNFTNTTAVCDVDVVGHATIAYCRVQLLGVDGDITV